MPDPLGVEKQTIRDFGDQWARFPDNEGFYASTELLADILGPLVDLQHLRGAAVADIGSGTGRIVNMLLRAGASHVAAIEPSEAFEVLKANVEWAGNKVTCYKLTGDQLPGEESLDYVFSIGVLHHIPDPGGVVRAAYRALRPGGRIVIWLYGKEGNRLYLCVFGTARVLTQRLPHAALMAVVRALDVPLAAYIWLCQRLPLPMHGYVDGVLRRLTPSQRRLVIYDQLNPAYARYYSADEARKLLLEGGFAGVQLYHRHGYSWTVVGSKF